jgi:CRP-like cAMP-binding protein
MEHNQVVAAVERAVDRHEIFGDLLTSREKEYLLDRGVVRSVMPGELLCRQFERDSRVFILVVGEVEVTTGEDHNRTHLAHLKQGEIFGEIAALFNMPRVSDVTVTRPSVVLEIASDVLSFLVEQRVALREAVLERYRQRITETALRSVPLFRYLPPFAMKRLMDQSTLVDAVPGGIVVEEGEVGDAFYVVVYGSLRVSHSIDGRHLNLALLKPGDYFGEWSLLTGAPRTATVSSLSQSELIAIDRPAFLEVVQNQPEIRDRIDLEAHNRLERVRATGDPDSAQQMEVALERIKTIIHNEI